MILFLKRYRSCSLDDSRLDMESLVISLFDSYKPLIEVPTQDLLLEEGDLSKLHTYCVSLKLPSFGLILIPSTTKLSLVALRPTYSLFLPIQIDFKRLAFVVDSRFISKFFSDPIWNTSCLAFESFANSLMSKQQKTLELALQPGPLFPSPEALQILPNEIGKRLNQKNSSTQSIIHRYSEAFLKTSLETSISAILFC